MKVETKRNLKIFLSGMLVTILIVGPGVYFIQKAKYEKIINKVYSFTPQIVYRKPSVSQEGVNDIVSKVYYGEWFDTYKRFPYFNYFRAFNKDYLVHLDDIEYSEVQGKAMNQIVISFSPGGVEEKIKKGETPNYTNKCWFENELRKYTDKNFSILNIDNFNQTHWIVNFETEITEEEKEKIKESLSTNIKDYFSIYYNQVLLPKYFYDYGRINLVNSGPIDL